MSSNSLFVDNEGTSIQMVLRDQDENPVNLTGASETMFIFQPPSGTNVEKVASIFGSPTDGILQYIVEPDTLNVIGEWQMQARIQLPTGKWTSSISKFHIKSNL